MNENEENQKLTAFTRNLILRRKEKHYTQNYLAQKSGISLSAIKQIELGNNSPTLDTILILSQALDCHPSSLLRDDTVTLIVPEPPPVSQDVMNAIKTAVKEAVKEQQDRAHKLIRDANWTEERIEMLVALLSAFNSHGNVESISQASLLKSIDTLESQIETLTASLKEFSHVPDETLNFIKKWRGEWAHINYLLRDKDANVIEKKKS